MNRSQIMSRIRSKDTTIELLVRKKLWSLGYRYRKNYKKIFGTPDLCFISKKIAVFLDSDFWHGRIYQDTGKLPKANREYWKKKLERNIQRDIDVNGKLREEGWTVIRIWESDIKSNFDICINKITTLLDKK